MKVTRWVTVHVRIITIFPMKYYTKISRMISCQTTNIFKLYGIVELICLHEHYTRARDHALSLL